MSGVYTHVALEIGVIYRVIITTACHENADMHCIMDHLLLDMLQVLQSATKHTELNPYRVGLSKDIFSSTSNLLEFYAVRSMVITISFS